MYSTYNKMENNFVYDKERQSTLNEYISKHFITTTNPKDRLHTQSIDLILNKQGYFQNTVELGRLLSRMNIGKYKQNCYINGRGKGGFEFIKYIENNV